MDETAVALVSMHTDPFADPGSGDVGGMNVIVKHAALTMAGQGRNVDVYIRRSDDAEEVIEVAENLRVHRLTAGPTRPATKSEQEAYVPEFRNALTRAEQSARDSGRCWEVIHSHHWFSGVAALDLARHRRIPHVQSYHSIAARTPGGWGLGEQPEGPGRVPAEAALARDSDAIIAVSRAEAHTAIDIGAQPTRVHVATPGVDHTVFHPGDRGEDPLHLSDRATIVAAARLEPLKGLDLAIATLARIPEQVRPRLVISGAPTAGYEGYDHTLHTLVEELGLRKDVWFAGPMTRTELATAMRRSRAVMVPSHSETYGLVALEAAACGTPVVAANVGGLGDAVLDGKTGVLIDGRDPGVWAERILPLLTDEALRNAMGARGAEHAERFTWAAMVSAWQDTYASVR